MFDLSILSIVSRIPAVAVPPQVTSSAPLIDQAQSNQLKVQSLSPTAFHNHSATHEQKSNTPHIDRFV